jgi:APA family basic amino acid/polyamine antiporter
VPLVPLVPALSLLATLWLSLNLTATTWRDFGIWMVVGLVLYGLYGRRHSALFDPAEIEALEELTMTPQRRGPRHRADLE